MDITPPFPIDEEGNRLPANAQGEAPGVQVGNLRTWRDGRRGIQVGGKWKDVAEVRHP